MKHVIVLLILFVTFTIAFSRTEAEKGTISITIKGIENKGGIMMIALFTEEDKFLKTPSYAKEVSISNETEIEVIFEDIPYRRYAFSIFHDLNENGELDSNMIMIPKEPIGFSNNYFPKFGPPKFKNAAFDLDKEHIRMTVNLKSY
jgi:uncharacterized protein (DUF2141 family)